MSTIVELLPNGDSEGVGWQDQVAGTTNLFQKIDETAAAPNDADWLVGPNPYPKRYTAAFQDPTIASNERIARVRLRLRLRAATADPYRLYFRYRNNVTGEVTAEESIPMNTTTFTSFTRPWYTTAPAGGRDPHVLPWSQQLASRIGIQMYAKASGGSLRVSQVSLELDKRTRATVTGVTVTGATTTTKPDISATYSDSVDNEDSTRHQVKVFDSGVYGASGFNPDASPAAWESGTVLRTIPADGGVVAATVGQDLVNGRTYKAYVRAAKPFNGDPWWTEWAASSPFTISLTPPAAPSLAVTADVDLTFSKLRTRLEVVGGAINLLSPDDSDLEGGVGTWVAHNNCTVAQSAAQANNGTKSLALTSVAAGDMEAKAAVGTAGVPVVSGRQYTMIWSTRAATAGRGQLGRITWYDAAGAFISNDSSTAPANSTGGWTQGKVIRNAPAGAAFAGPRVVIQATGGAGEVHYLDTISFHEGTSTVWQPGGNSTDLLVVERAQLNDGILNLAHPQVASGTEQTLTQAGYFVSDPLDSLLSDERTSVAGRRSLGWVVGSTTSKLTIGLPAGTFGLDQAAYALLAIPGATMVLSLYARASTATTATLALEAVDQAGNVLGAASSKAITIPAGAAFARFSIPLSGVHADAVFLRASITNTSGQAGQTVNVDAVQLREDTAAAALLAGDVSTFDATAGGWVNNANATVARVTTPTRSGAGALGLTSVAAGTMSARHANAVAGAVPVTAGRTYTLDGWFRAATTPRSCQVGINWFDAGQNFLASSFAAPVADTTTGWTQLLVLDAAPAGAALAQLIAQVSSTGGASEVHYVDDVMLRLTDPDSQAWASGQGRTLGWQAVRGGDALPPGSSDNPRVLYDEEAPPGRVLLYRATAVRTPDTVNRLSSTPTVDAAVKLAPPAQHVLKDPLNPQEAMPVRIMDGPDQIAEDAEVLRPIGRRDPVVVSAGMTGRDRQLILLAEGQLAIAQLERLLKVPSALLLQFGADLGGGMRYVRLTSRDLQIVADWRALFVTADSLEVGAPV